jgi:DNA-binding transcriptional LysR family regulator
MAWRMDDMVAFLRVVEAGSVTGAAGELGVAKSVVSKRLRDLEEALGVQLLRRTTRRVVATEQGQALHARMSALLREVDDAVEEVVEGEGPLRGRLRVAAPMSFGTLHLGPILLAFARAHPQLELAVDLDDRMLDLVASGADLAVRIGVSSDASLIARKLCVARRVLCCSPGYAQERGLPRSIDEIVGHATIDYANLTATRLWQFEPARRGEKPRSVATRSRIVANNGETMRDAALAGMGLAILPLFIVAPALRDGSLIQVLPDEEPVALPISAVYPPTRRVSRKVRALVDHLVRAFRNPPPWERERGVRHAD